MVKRSLANLAATGAILTAAVLATGCSNNKLSFNTSEARQGKLDLFVTATGSVEPVNEVVVGTQVSGIVEKIYVDYNSQVKKGDLLAELDKSTLREKLTQAKASQSNAQSDLTYAQQNFERIRQLYEAGAATQAAFEEATNRYSQTKNVLLDADANLRQAEVNLSYAEIYSPISGVILNREVEEGQTVAATFSTPDLFTIADDLTKMQVEADVDEADIGRVKEGQRVTFTVDAYPDDVFDGTVRQIRIAPVETNNVITYVVVIDAPNPDLKLLPGLTANVSILTDSAEGLIVPAEALYFVPSETVMKALKIDPAQIKKGRYVWVKAGEGIEQREITTGLNDGVNFIVKSGLEKGEQVVMSVFKTSGAPKNSSAGFPGPGGPGGGPRR